ncbi:hypothetical protein [Spiroplasma endosymbiont of Nebria brevicollis]|uniref:hypothetical protein n=1 Tax=Spiroplasma endosymbiont of Nebria brevicollis TaxID=3066284 RepID=UPI00313D66AB
MRFKKLLQIISSLTLLTPLITLTIACQQSDDKTITFLNPNITQALKLYDDKGNSLIQQYLFDQYDKDNIEKYRIQAGTRCLDFNSFPDFDQNSLLNLQPQDYITYPELNDYFMTNVLKIPKNASQFYDWTTSSLIKIRVVPESYVVSNDISLKFNHKDKIVDFQAPATTCNIEFYNSETNQVLVTYKINVSSSFLNIANQKFIIIDEKDISYDSIHFHNQSIVETGNFFNERIFLKSYDLNKDTINTQDLAKILHAQITFKLYDMEKQRLVFDQEPLNSITNYEIGFELNDIYVNTIFKVGQRTDPIPNI